MRDAGTAMQRSAAGARARHLVGQDGVDARVAQARHHPAQALHLVLAHLALQARRLRLHGRVDGVGRRVVRRRAVPAAPISSLPARRQVARHAAGQPRRTAGPDFMSHPATADATDASRGDGQQHRRAAAGCRAPDLRRGLRRYERQQDLDVVEQEARAPALGRRGRHAHARVVLHARLHAETVAATAGPSAPAQSDAATEPPGSNVQRTTGRLLVRTDVSASLRCLQARSASPGPARARPDRHAQPRKAAAPVTPGCLLSPQEQAHERVEEAGVPAPWRCTASARCAAAQARPRRAASPPPWSPSRCPWQAPPPPRPWARLPSPGGAPRVSTV